MSPATTETHIAATGTPVYEVRHIALTAPFAWIRQGIADFRRVPGLSLLYGLLFAGLCAGLYLLSLSVPWYAIGYLTGLVVSGPFLAAGLYTASRAIEHGEPPSIAGGLRLLLQRSTYLALFSLLLALIMAAWVRFSALVFAIKFNTLTPSIEAYRDMLGSADGWIALAFFIGIGFLLAAVVFVVSAVAIPLILDRDSDFITAIQTSYHAVIGSIGAMTIWAACIVVLTVVGVATAFLGLILLFPVLGYATWHSYRALVR